MRKLLSDISNESSPTWQELVSVEGREVVAVAFCYNCDRKNAQPGVSITRVWCPKCGHALTWKRKRLETINGTRQG